MPIGHPHRRAFLQLVLAGSVLPYRGFAQQDKPLTGVALDPKTGTWHVQPNGRIQHALEAAAKDPVNKKVVVHAGTYRPAARGQALVWFNARHDGKTFKATLSGPVATKKDKAGKEYKEAKAKDVTVSEN